MALFVTREERVFVQANRNAQLWSSWCVPVQSQDHHPHSDRPPTRSLQPRDVAVRQGLDRGRERQEPAPVESHSEDAGGAREAAACSKTPAANAMRRHRDRSLSERAGFQR